MYGHVFTNNQVGGGNFRSMLAGVKSALGARRVHNTLLIPAIIVELSEREAGESGVLEFFSPV